MRTTYPLMLPRQHLSLSRTYPGKRPAVAYLPAPHGFSLVELMIAMLIGLILTAGMIQIFTGSSQTYRYIESLSRVQENGRFALNTLRYDLRQAGFRGGCQVPVNNLLNEAHGSYDPDLFDLNNAIRGWNNEQGDAPSDYHAGTDVIVIKHAANITGLVASGNTPANAANINLTTASGILQGTIVVVGDIQSCDMFQNTANQNATNLNRGSGAGGASPGNKNPGHFDFSKSYAGDLQIFTFTSYLYYIGNGVNGQPALRRVRYDRGFTITPPNDEIIEGVRDMQITYLQGDTYVTANNVTNWGNVSAVRVSLLLQSERANLVDAPMTLPYNDAAFTAPDRRFYQVFTTTVALRNRLP